MLLDNELVFSDSQAITATAASTNIVDLGGAGMGAGNSLEMLAHVEEAFNNLTSLNVAVQSCAAENFGSGVVTHQKFDILLADLTAGKQIDLGPLLNGALQYVRLYYTVTGTAPSTGKITATILPYNGQTLPNQA